MLTIEEVYNAAKVLKDVARHPHLVPCKVVDDAQIYLKPECLQHTGSFKLRGAYYKISQLTPANAWKLPSFCILCPILRFGSSLPFFFAHQLYRDC